MCIRDRSIYDETLNQINRGCSHGEFVEAVKLLENSKLDLCVHTIFGFPWETREMMYGYIHEINRFPQIKFVKFHHLHIVEGSITVSYTHLDVYKRQV